MKKREYDIVYLTNTPSFYKLNLCEAIALKGVRILLVLYGYGAEAVNRKLDPKCLNFDFEFIHAGDSNRRNKLATFLRLCRLMRGIRAGKVIYSGWLAPEYNLYSLLSPKSRNVVINESRADDIGMAGLRGRVKRLVVGRMSGALPSGQPQKEFFDRLGFRGQVECTGSVGLFAKGKRSPRMEMNRPPKFLYVGRLIDCKNLEFLVRAFTKWSHLQLTIVGKGEDEAKLKAIAGPNITFTGFIDNDRLAEVYDAHDVFILPSKYEPWGLVVEEALYRGLPVLVSDKVGSGPDLVRDLHSGFFFQHDDEQSLRWAIDELFRTWPQTKRRVLDIDWDSRESDQIAAYLRILGVQDKSSFYP